MLEGKTALVVGVANNRSIAWAIASRLAEKGARLALTYQGDRLRENVEELAAELDSPVLAPLDVTDDAQINALFEKLRNEFGSLDVLVHSVAFANREELKGGYSATSREGFALAHDISSYSLTALTRGAIPLMEGREASVLTMTFMGSERTFPNYNVMGVAKASLEASVRYLASELGEKGIRVNAISAGPIKTLAAAGITGLSELMAHYRAHSPLRRTVDTSEVADTALFLASSMSRGITGEVIHVDGGFHIIGT